MIIQLIIVIITIIQLIIIHKKFTPNLTVTPHQRLVALPGEIINSATSMSAALAIRQRCVDERRSRWNDSIPTVKMEHRHTIEGPIGNEFSSIYIVREL